MESTISKEERRLWGVGIPDADYPVKIRKEFPREFGKRNQKVVWRCPFFMKWENMLSRCYSKAYQSKQPSYIGAIVCEEWLTFSNFKSWMEKQDWEGKQLDKDLLGDGKLYSPDTCCFVTQLVNSFVTEARGKRGPYPIGVYWSKVHGKFMSRCCQLGGGERTLGYFDNPEQGHKVWLEEKLRLSKILAEGIEDDKVAQALVNRYENYEYE